MAKWRDPHTMVTINDPGHTEGWLKLLVGALFVIALFGGGCACTVWRYQECLKVGHSGLYCAYSVVSEK